MIFSLVSIDLKLMNFFQLNRPPSFYEESTPIPKKHTIWNISSDFTSGQALNYRFVLFFINF